MIMKAFTLILVLFLFSYTSGRDEGSKILLSIEQCFSNEESISLCHVDLKAEEVQWSEITVSFKALPSHLLHGCHISNNSCHREYSK